MGRRRAMDYYWLYYLLMALASLIAKNPLILVGVAIFFILRPFIPDPVVWLRTAGRIRALEAQVQANASNVTARRELAELYIERLRPAKAIKLIDEALARDDRNADLLYLSGLARHRSGDAKGALEPLVRAVTLDPMVRFGEPYWIAAEALLRLNRLEEAEDALERYTDTNTSSIQGHVRLATVRRRLGDSDGAKKALEEAFTTWSEVPGFQRRRQLGWYLRAQLARLFI